MRLLHKWDNYIPTNHYGINYLTDERSKIEIAIRFPLPFIRAHRWKDFKTMSLIFGKQILNMSIYFRIRKNYKWKYKWWQRIIVYCHLGWKNIWSKVILTRRQMELMGIKC